MYLLHLTGWVEYELTIDSTMKTLKGDWDKPKL